MVSIEVQLFGLKLKFRNFCGLLTTFVEATGKKQAGGGAFLAPPPHPEYIKKKVFPRNIISEKIACRKTSPGKLPNGAQPLWITATKVSPTKNCTHGKLISKPRNSLRTLTLTSSFGANYTQENCPRKSAFTLSLSSQKLTL